MWERELCVREMWETCVWERNLRKKCVSERNEGNVPQRNLPHRNEGNVPHRNVCQREMRETSLIGISLIEMCVREKCMREMCEVKIRVALLHRPCFPSVSPRWQGGAIRRGGRDQKKGQSCDSLFIHEHFVSASSQPPLLINRPSRHQPPSSSSDETLGSSESDEMFDGRWSFGTSSCPATWWCTHLWVLHDSFTCVT